MTILCYHSVDPDWRSPLAVSPSEFATHCSWLARARHVVPLGEAVQRLDRSGRLRGRMTAITFDDGFAGLYHHAMPTLRRTGLPVTVFLVAETLTARGRPVDWASPPPQTGTLTLDQVLEMKEAGVRFGSHSYSHHDLTGLPEDTVTNDLRASRELLAELLGEEIRFLAYPGGRHNEAVRRAARAAGFTHGFTLPDKAETPGAFAIPRVGVYPGNGTMALRIKSSQLYLSARPMAVFPALRSVARRLSRSRTSRD